MLENGVLCLPMLPLGHTVGSPEPQVAPTLVALLSTGPSTAFTDWSLMPASLSSRPCVLVTLQLEVATLSWLQYALF